MRIQQKLQLVVVGDDGDGGGAVGFLWNSFVGIHWIEEYQPYNRKRKIEFLHFGFHYLCACVTVRNWTGFEGRGIFLLWQMSLLPTFQRRWHVTSHNFKLHKKLKGKLYQFSLNFEMRDKTITLVSITYSTLKMW